MISPDLAARLRDAGLIWHPADGDRFQIDAPELAADVFTVSTMTIQAHEFPTGTILGFNGTTEWALDSVAIEDALWLPREDQLRDLLRSTFLGLRRAGERYEVDVELLGERRTFADDDPAEAYGTALLALVGLSS
ncbi:pilus assembly protein CpaE [Isoptericola sp. NPDC057191]|uniref:pilus assembly protein CpaE n=1 Tax=Isoptericola sp. NPDC057191 TaxID=3346041 RepID=UPI003635EE0D